MHIARQTSHEPVVVDGSRWVSAICAAGALFGAYCMFTQHERQGLIFFAVLALFAMIFDLRKEFTFDRMQQVVRRKGAQS